MSAGLSLRTGISGSANYSPMTPGAAQSPTSGSIAQRAYGISGTGVDTGTAIAGYGGVGVGMLAIAALVYLWWSLPR
jgi:hypothetical protein